MEQCRQIDSAVTVTRWTDPTRFLSKQVHQIAMEMHPLNNFRVLQYLENELAMNEEKNLPVINTGLRKVLEP